jgi:hypothetical protein
LVTALKTANPSSVCEDAGRDRDSKLIGDPNTSLPT